jgi:predicted RNA-binding Zn-ribbon protein involved in translation (DUF1610 family)
MKRATLFACPGCRKNLIIYQDYEEQKISIYTELDVTSDPHDPAAKPVKKSGATQRRCKKCGEVGHRRDNCPTNEGGTIKDKIRKLADEGLSSEEIADRLGVSLAAVNKYW